MPMPQPLVSVRSRLVHAGGLDWGAILTIATGAYVLMVLAWQHFGWGGPGTVALVSAFTFVPSSLAAAVLAWRAASRPALEQAEQRAWRLLGASFLLYWMGDIVWFYYQAVLHLPPLPSWADFFYVLQYPVLFWGLLSFPAAPIDAADRLRFWLDAVIVMIGAWMGAWYLALGPLATKGGVSGLALWLSAGYPVGDVLLCFGVGMLLLRHPRGQTPGALRYLATGLMLICLGDLIHANLNLRAAYTPGHWVDAIWLIGRYLMVVSAYVQYRRSGKKRRLAPVQESVRYGSGYHLLPYTALALSFGLMLYVVRMETTAFGLLAGAAVVTICVAVRQVLVFTENARLLAEGKSLTEELRRSESRFRSLVQHSSDVIGVVEADASIRYVSPAIGTVLGHAPAELVGSGFGALVHPTDLPATIAALSKAGTHRLQARLRHKDGAWRHTETTVNNLLGEAGVEGIVLTIRDVSERKALEEQLTQQAFHDALTSLANRTLLHDRAEQALVEHRERKEPLALLFVDLDGFKTVNDSLGHTAGDELLMEVAGRLVACVRTDDTVARLGGDEFAILVEGTDVTVASRVATRILEALGAPFSIQNKEIYVYASVGIAMSHGDVENADALLRNADMAMYTAKGQGKGRFAIFEPSMHTAALQRLETEADLRWAVENQEFYLEYQPAVWLKSGAIAGVEALVRWRHPRRGNVYPGEFIGLAEETGMIIPLGRWVLNEACRQGALWQQAYSGPEPLKMSVNLSARQLCHPDMLAHLASALRESGIAPSSLVLEITESVLMQGEDAIITTLERIKAMGVLLAIDDFGTGYSSLSYLRRFPVDIVKIDRSFVDAVGHGVKESALVRGIIDLSHALGLTTIAEGIERMEQWSELSTLHCGMGQGYYFSRPTCADSITAMIEKTSHQSH